MDALYLSTEGNDSTRLCIAPLTKQLALASGEDVGSCAGYFLYEGRGDDPEDIEILARVASEDAAVRLAKLLNLR